MDHYGDLKWWPATSPYEVITGAILTQNTAWTNVELALANLGDRLTPEFIQGIEMEDLKQLIRPAGFYNQKARYLKAVTDWYANYNFSAERVKQVPLQTLRQELLAVKGVGPETADSILLYAFDFPTFVVDAYTKRFCRRFPLSVGKTYDRIKLSFEENLPVDATVYNQYHALIVFNGKDHCKARPLCDDCPLNPTCKKLLSQ